MGVHRGVIGESMDFRRLVLTAKVSGDWRAICRVGCMGAFQVTFAEESERGGRGLLANRSRTSPPASEREARMDDPTRRLQSRKMECTLSLYFQIKPSITAADLR